jgi:hypothetical protein
MNKTLYEQFSIALLTLPETEVPDALEFAEDAITRRCRRLPMNAAFEVSSTVEDLPPGRLLRVFEGRRLSEVVEVIRQLRHEIADAMARRGASPETVRELRACRLPGHNDVEQSA